MSFVFCKLLNIGTLGTHHDAEDETMTKEGNVFPSTTIVFAILIIFMAVIAKLMGF